LLLLATAATADARARTDAARCLAAKARAAAGLIERTAACRAENVLAGGTAGPACFVAAGAPVAEALERADRLGPCGGNHAYLVELARSSCVRSPHDFTRCNAAKIRATGELAAGKVRCLGSAGGAVDPACFAGHESRYATAFARADRMGPCPGDLAFFTEGVDACVAALGVALGCGNGRIDPGEQCDGQIFCTARECRILREIGCCQVGTPPAAICADVFPEMCFAAGFQTAPGFCMGDPLGGDVCQNCKVGGCTDPPIPATSVCCERAGSCQAGTVGTTVGLQNALQQCLDAGGQPFLAECTASGRCAAGAP
jgi:hypothetical protein